MATPNYSRRAVLGTSTLLASAGVFADVAPATAHGPRTVNTLLNPVTAANVQSGLNGLAGTATRLSRLDIAPALFSALLDLPSGVLASGGFKHKGLVRRVRNPATAKSPINPHFAPQGNAFDADERQRYAPRAVGDHGL